MLKTLVTSLFVFLFAGIVQLSAQCIDSTHIQNGAYCDPHWDPVCGCDGYTYRNDCFSRNAGLMTWVYGICDPVDFDFYPNPPQYYINVDAILKVQGDLYVQVIDRFGKLYYSNVYPGVTRFQFQIDISAYPTGVYFINCFCNDGYRVKKVVVIEDLQ